MSDQEDYAAFQEWKAGRDAASQAAEAAKISFPNVLHKIIDAVSWNHTADRDAAHAAVDKQFTPGEGGDAPPAPPTVVTTPANTDQGIMPAGVSG